MTEFMEEYLFRGLQSSRRKLFCYFVKIDIGRSRPEVMVCTTMRSCSKKSRVFATDFDNFSRYRCSLHFHADKYLSEFRGSDRHVGFGLQGVCGTLLGQRRLNPLAFQRQLRLLDRHGHSL